MLPHTHFLVALMLGLLAWKEGVISWELAIIAGIIAVIIDIDHVYSYHKRHGDWSVEGAWKRAVSYHEHERTIIHKPYGFIVLTIILVVIGVIFSPTFTIVGGLAYYSHYFLDQAHVKYERMLKEGKISIPLNTLEITLDIICLAVVLILFFA